MRRLWRRMKFVWNIKKSIPFLVRFFRSKEVSRSQKGLSFVMIIGYLLLPWDLIPDFLVFLGVVDDLAVLTYILQLMVKMAPASLREEYGIRV